MSDRPLYLVRFPASAEREVLVYARTPAQARRVALREVEATCTRARPMDIVRLVADGSMPIEAPDRNSEATPSNGEYLPRDYAAHHDFDDLIFSTGDDDVDHNGR
jgi:hypothetical protein